MIAPASAIEEVSRAVRVETWQSWLLASKRENVVNTKVLAGFTRHIEMCRGEASIAADGKREAVTISFHAYHIRTHPTFLTRTLNVILTSL